MFRALILGRDSLAVRALQELVAAAGDVSCIKTFTTIPSSYEFIQLVQSYDVNLLLVDLATWPDSQSAVQQFGQRPQATVIGFASTAEQRHLPWSSLGVASLLPSTPDLRDFQLALRRALHATQVKVFPNVFAFLPAKAGSGASTTALHVAGVMAQQQHQRVLLLETDLHTGVLSVLLRLAPGGSILNALEQAPVLDHSILQACVTQAHQMDLLVRVGRPQGLLPSWGQYHQLLHFACPRYNATVIDLPEIVNEATFETVRRASLVCVVCTPELPSLVLARQRSEELREKGIQPERIRLVVNRWHSRDMSTGEMEQFVGTPVAAVLPNDYAGVQQAILDSRLVEPKSRLGIAYTNFATRLAQPEALRGELTAPSKSGLLGILRTRFAS